MKGEANTDKTARDIRVAGTIRTIHRVGIGTKHESMYGVIEGADGRFYTWNAYGLYRDTTRAKADASCTFVVRGEHATSISTADLTVG